MQLGKLLTGMHVGAIGAQYYVDVLLVQYTESRSRWQHLASIPGTLHEERTSKLTAHQLGRSQVGCLQAIMVLDCCKLETQVHETNMCMLPTSTDGPGK